MPAWYVLRHIQTYEVFLRAARLTYVLFRDGNWRLSDGRSPTICSAEAPTAGGHIFKDWRMTPVVLITGALSGIGRATAIAFAKEGVRLIVSGRPAHLATLVGNPRGQLSKS